MKPPSAPGWRRDRIRSTSSWIPECHARGFPGVRTPPGANCSRGRKRWEGVFTHFHSAESDLVSVERQWERFSAVLQILPGRPPLVHAANSAAALLGPTYACDLVRPGIFLYGGNVGRFRAEPVVRLRARVVAQRDIGAGDGVSYGATWTAKRDTRSSRSGLATRTGCYARSAIRARWSSTDRSSRLWGGSRWTSRCFRWNTPARWGTSRPCSVDSSHWMSSPPERARSAMSCLRRWGHVSYGDTHE